MATEQSNRTSFCNVTAYREWYSSQLLESDAHVSLEKLRNALLDVSRSDVDVWRIDFDSGPKRDDFVELYSGRKPETLEISIGRVMELATVWCEEELNALWSEIAGGHGPPSNISIHDAMCNEYCLASDSLRVQSMEISQCDCMELTTENSNFCSTNSAAMLCYDSSHEMCRGIIEDCDLNDFHFGCPRRKYDMIEVPSRGLGSECASLGSILVLPVLSTGCAALALIYILIIF